MKKFIMALLSFTLLTSAAIAANAEDDIQILVNGTPIVTDVAPFIENDRTLVPVRAITEALNCDVAWNEETQGVTIYRNNHFYEMWIGKDTMFDIENGAFISNSCKADVPPVIVNDRTFLPLRAVSELIGAKVDWNGDTKTVTVDYELGELEENEGVAEIYLPYEEVLNRTYDIYKAYVEDTIEKVLVKIDLDNNKVIELELYPDIAPQTCGQFVALAKSGAYDGTIFHRVIEDFVIQGGGYYSDESEVEAEYVYGEFLANGILNLLPHKRGAISLARADHVDSGSSQFFIVQTDSPHLDGYYAAFGKVTSGIEYVDEITKTETDESGRPKTDIVIKSVTVIE